MCPKMVFRAVSWLMGHRSYMLVCETVVKTKVPGLPASLVHPLGQGALVVLPSPVGRSNVSGSSGSAMQKQH